MRPRLRSVRTAVHRLRCADARPGGAVRRAGDHDRPGPQHTLALDVPAIGVHTTGLVDLGLTSSGALDIPENATTAGWFALSPVPGEVGPAVLAAHVDYDKKPGVFARLTR